MSEKKERARTELLRRKNTIAEKLGENFETSPRFASMVDAVAGGRSAWLVIDDLHSDESPQPAKRRHLHGDGWAW